MITDFFYYSAVSVASVSAFSPASEFSSACVLSEDSSVFSVVSVLSSTSELSVFSVASVVSAESVLSVVPLDVSACLKL